MAEGSKWTPGKIFLLIAGILGGLALICCGGFWLMFGDKVMAGIAFGKNTARFTQKLQSDFGTDSVFEFKQNDKAEWILAIAVKDELTPERVTKLQDSAWRAVGECYGQDGFFPVKHVAIGRPGPGSKPGHGVVVDYSANSVDVDELVKRTNVPAPPLVKFLPEEAFSSGSSVHAEYKTETKSTEGEGGGEGDGGGEGK